MTVKEIIEKLSKMPQDADIYIETEDNLYLPKSIELWVNPEDKNIYECFINIEQAP